MYVNDYVLSYLSQGCKLHPIFRGGSPIHSLESGCLPKNAIGRHGRGRLTRS
jgi:hypothetical protein